MDFEKNDGKRPKRRSRKEQLTLHEMAVRLCEGGTVWFQSLQVKAVEVKGFDPPCDFCDMDCLCHGEMVELCEECDHYTGKMYRLKLA